MINKEGTGSERMQNYQRKRFLGIPDEFWIGFVFLVGFFLKLVYDINAGYLYPTADVGTWENMVGKIPNEGHIGVIQYYYTYFRFPDVDLRQFPEFTNPPLFYWVSAGILFLIHHVMGWAVGTSLHLLQCVNVIYVLVGSACGVGMVYRFGIRGRKLTISFLFLSFFSAFYILGASLTPDAMAFMFSMLALSNGLVWYETRRSRDFYKTAIAIGFGLMSSFTVLMILPAVYTLYYFAKRDGRRNETPLGRQLLISVIFIALLGGWWPVFRMVKYHIPLFYSRFKDIKSYSVSGYSIFSRLRIPTVKELTELNSVGLPKYEHNIWAQIFKTALTGFAPPQTGLRSTRNIAVFTLYLSIFLSILMHIMWFYMMCTARLEKPMKRFLAVGYFSMLLVFIILCFRYPYTYMMDFKLIAPTVIFPVIGSGLCGYGSGNDNTFERITTWIADGMTLVYAILTAFLFGFYF